MIHGGLLGGDVDAEKSATHPGVEPLLRPGCTAAPSANHPPGCLFCGVAVGASSEGLLGVGGSPTTGLIVAGPLGRWFSPWFGFTLDPVLGQRGPHPDPG